MRWGIIGWGTRTGIGTINWSFWRTGRFATWLMPAHPERIPLAAAPDDPGIVQTDLRDERALAQWLSQIDALFFTERPFFDDAIPIFLKAKRRGLLIACEPVAEWIPPSHTAWLHLPDVMWAPTRHTFPVLRTAAQQVPRSHYPFPWTNHIVGGRWGIELARWPFKLRTVCRRFLFCNGGGGCLGRKGLAVVLEAARRAPECSVLIRSQVPIPRTAPANVELRVGNDPDQAGLYSEGDVLLAPSLFEGYGYSLYEAQACGMPVIATNFPPMDEAGAAWPLACSGGLSHSLCGRPFEYAQPSAVALAAIMRAVNGRSIEAESRAAFERSRAWEIGDVVADLQRYTEALLPPAL